ncbi:MAG: hypothetical protein LAT81_14360, partial [Oceanicaulis sp.]|nr:hypothetical protein [Oceanicaulis sp.]
MTRKNILFDLEPASEKDFLMYYLTSEQLSQFRRVDKDLQKYFSRQRLHPIDYLLAIALGVLVGCADQIADNYFTYDNTGKRINNSLFDAILEPFIVDKSIAEKLNSGELNYLQVLRLISKNIFNINLKSPLVSEGKFSKHIDNIGTTDRYKNAVDKLNENIPLISELLSDVVIDVVATAKIKFLLKKIAIATFYRDKPLEQNSAEFYLLALISFNTYSIVQLALGQTNCVIGVGMASYYLFKLVTTDRKNTENTLDYAELINKANQKLMHDVEMYEKDSVSYIRKLFKLDEYIIAYEDFGDLNRTT